MKKEGYPQDYPPLSAVLERLEISEQRFYRSGIATFLSHYQIGRSKLYLADEVNRVRYWLFVRKGMIALGYRFHNWPLLPPGKNVTEKWIFLEAWFDEDPNGTECPKCGRNAVQDDLRTGPVWCLKCGIQNTGENNDNMDS